MAAENKKSGVVINSRRLTAALAKSTRLDTGAKLVGGRQRGSQLTTGALHAAGVYFVEPERRYLAEYEGAYRCDPYIHDGINKLVLSMLASLGPYVHEDPRAMKYVGEMDTFMEGNVRDEFGQLLISCMWAGYGVSEMDLVARDGLVWPRALLNYHPLSIHVVPNKQGRLEDKGDNPAHAFLPHTGIWQRINLAATAPDRILSGTDKHLDYVHLPMSKIVYLRRGARHGNHAGESLLTPIWDRLQASYETMKDLLITLERYGSPQVAVIVPKATTSETKTVNNEVVFKSLAEVIAERMAILSVSNGIIAEEPVGLPGDPKIRFQNISSFNNFAEAFHGTLRFLYRDILIGMGIPPMLVMEMESSGLSGGTLARVQSEMYKQLITSLYREFVEPFVQQFIGRLLYINFGITSPGRFEFNPFDLAAAETLMNVFAAANEEGVIDTSIEEDLQMVRAKLGLPLASAKSIKQRLANNATLMEARRRPDVDKVGIATIRAEAQKTTAKGSQRTQETNARVMADSNLAIAELKAKVERAKLRVKSTSPPDPPAA